MSLHSAKDSISSCLRLSLRVQQQGLCSMTHQHTATQPDMKGHRGFCTQPSNQEDTWSQVRYVPNKSWRINVHVKNKWGEAHGSNLEGEKFIVESELSRIFILNISNLQIPIPRTSGCCRKYLQIIFNLNSN